MRVRVCYILISCLVGAFPLAAQYATELVVAADGTGEYNTIQEAIDATKSFPDVPITIHIKAGVYNEKVRLHAWNTKLALKGEGAEKTILRWGDSFNSIDRGRNSTFHTATLTVQGDEASISGLTIENTAGPVGQAVALAVEADRCTITDCRILGHQDTLYADGANARQYYRNCLIAGTTDFIFGSATAFFEECEVRSLANSYITAASTPEGRKYGFVFDRCHLTAGEGVDAVFLGRPWRDAAQTVFLNCTMDAHIRQEGWSNWSGTGRDKTAFYAEYQNSGPGADMTGRVPWCHRLSAKEAEKYARGHVLAPFALPEMQIK